MHRIIDGRKIYDVDEAHEGIICPYCDRLTAMKRAVDGGIIRFCKMDEAIWWFHPDGRIERLS